MTAATSGPTYRRGFWLAIILAMLFLAGSAVQSVATFLVRTRGDVMRAATGSVFVGHISREVIYFVAAQLLLHFFFGVAIWILAWATTVAWPSARARFGRLVVAWFCALAAATIAYNITWFPRTGLGAYYHDPAAIQIGPLMATSSFTAGSLESRRISASNTGSSNEVPGFSFAVTEKDFSSGSR